MRDGLRILVVTPFLWSGAGKAIVRLARDLQALGHRLHVVSSGESKAMTDWPAYVDQLRAAAIPYTTIDFFDRAPDVFWKSVEALRAVATGFQPDLIHGHSGVAAFGALAAGVAPVIATLHSWAPDRPAWMNTMDVWALNQCDRVACVSSSYRDYLIAKGLRRDLSEVIHLGVESEEIQKLASLHVDNPLAGRKYFCFLGRLEPRKRQTLLVETLKRLPEDWCLMLIGAEVETGFAQRIAGVASAQGVSDRVVLTGQVPNPYPLVRQACCFVSASGDEGLGLSALEAMSLGVPVIATRARGIVDFVHDGETGLFAEAHPAAIAEKILYLEAHPDRVAALRGAGLAAIRDVFNWKKTVFQYLEQYGNLINGSIPNSQFSSEQTRNAVLPLGSELRIGN
jgi:glycosyltransferase involved in cell wall biosynthesis